MDRQLTRKAQTNKSNTNGKGSPGNAAQNKDMYAENSSPSITA